MALCCLLDFSDTGKCLVFLIVILVLLLTHYINAAIFLDWHRAFQGRQRYTMYCKSKIFPKSSARNPEKKDHKDVSFCRAGASNMAHGLNPVLEVWNLACKPLTFPCYSCTAPSVSCCILRCSSCYSHFEHRENLSRANSSETDPASHTFSKLQQTSLTEDSESCQL